MFSQQFKSKNMNTSSNILDFIVSIFNKNKMRAKSFNFTIYSLMFIEKQKGNDSTANVSGQPVGKGLSFIFDP